MFDKAGVLAEIVGLAVFEHEEAPVLDKAGLHHAVGQRGQFGKGVGRVSEDEAETLAAAADEAQGVGAQHGGGTVVQLAERRGDESVVRAVQLDSHHAGAAPREELQGDAARPGEEVERRCLLKVDVGAQHVEEVFLGEVGRRARFERARHVEVAALYFPVITLIFFLS